MARFADSVMFTPVSTGTVDFVVSAAVQGYMTPAGAGAVTGTYRYRAESADLSQWEIGEGTYTSGTVTLTRTTVFFNNLGTTAKINFTVAPNVGLVQTTGDTLGVDQANAWSATQRSQARTNISAVLKGHIYGLTLSAAGGSATFGIAAGEAADSTSADLLVLASAYTKTTSAWAVGTGNGGMDTSTVAASTWYHVHLIKRPDTGVVDVLFSLSATAPTLPTNYTLFRRIGSMKTDGSSQWIKFLQLEDEFWWDTPINDVAATNPGTTAVTRTLTVPTGLKVIAIFAATGFVTGTQEGRCYISPLDVADVAPSTASVNAGSFSAPGTTQVGSVAPLRVRTNTSAQIRTRHISTAADVALYVATHGWADTRGRLG